MGARAPRILPQARRRLETRFPEAKPLLSATEALAEASRCLYCFEAPCIGACPTSIDIPSFIRKIATGNLRGAARTILRSNLLGASCARVCPVEVLCEGACVYTTRGGRAVPIGRLQRYAMELGGSRPAALLGKAPPSGRSVGLVGAGPASLACAGALALRGHRPVIYEKRRLAGGLNSTGIAPYKMRVEDALAEVEALAELGMEIRTGVAVGEEISAEELLARHEAVFLGPGLGGDSMLGIPGEEGAGVEGALGWIERMKTAAADPPRAVERALVVGGGNTAVDAARELRRLGVASVTILYRRTRAEMKAYDHEIRAALEEGAILRERVTLAEVLREGDQLKGARLVETEGGRPTARSAGEMPCELVLVAIGQAKLSTLARTFPGVSCDAQGRIEVDPRTGRTGNPRVFAGGDAVNGGKEVVHAVSEGQLAARSIDRLLRAEEESASQTLGGSHG